MNELISNGFYIDLTDNIPIPVSFAIADVKDPSKRKRNFSKDISLPDTSNNRRFFAGAFALNITDNTINFDPTAKVEAALYKRGVNIMPNALIKLNSVTRKEGNLEFSINLFSETVDAYLLLQGINVNELDWSAYDHTLSQANIVASWSATPGTGYYYPLIERGNGRPALTTWRTTDFVPYVYWAEVLIKLLEYAGIEYSSNFLEDTLAESVLFGYGGGNLITYTTAQKNQVKVDIDTGDFNRTYSEILPDYGTGLVTGGYIGFQQITESEFTYNVVSDALSQFDDVEITIQRPGNYKLTVSMLLDWAITGGLMTFEEGYSPQLHVRRNGAVLFYPYTVESGQTGTVDLSRENTLWLEAGDVISFWISRGTYQFSHSGTVEQVDYDITTNTPIEILLENLDTQITDGANVDLTAYIPPMKGSDFLLGSIREFNLYMADPDIYGVTEIEPLSDFYTGTNVFDDITDLIDYTKPFIVKPTANEYAKNIKLLYKENKDYDAKVYQERWGERYGDLNYEQGSYYAKGEMVIQMPWSGIVPYEIATGLLIPRFIEIDNNNNIKPNKGEPRIMIRNGDKTGAWTLTDGDGSNASAKATYPCVHHFDDWENPTFDLNFKLVQEVYYTASVVTNVNTYSEYYDTFIQEMVSPAGKLIDCYVKWHSKDVQRRDFGKLLMINGALFRLNIVKDFDDMVSDSCNIELIKVLKAKKRRAGGITYGTPQIPIPTNPLPPKKFVTTVDANYTIDPDVDQFINVTVKGVTITTSDPTGTYTGSEFFINNASNGNIIVDAGAYTINGRTPWILPPNNGMHIISNGSEFRID